MPKTIKQVKRIAEDMVGQDKGLREAQTAYERMSRLQYSLPGPLADFEWVRPIISTSPYDALRGATRALSNLDERLTIHPVTVAKSLGVADDSRQAAVRANEWETVLKWQMGRLAGRRQAFRSSVIWSACLYHEIVGKLIHLPTEFKARDIPEERKAAALRFGDWAIRLVDPKTVHIDYSDYMPERTLSVQVKTARQLVEYYGKDAKKIQSKIDRNRDHATDPYVEFDFVDYDTRHIWVVEGNDEALVTEEGIVLMEPETWLRDTDGKAVPFLPWVAVAGGIDVDAAKEHQRKPILYPVYQAEQWATANIFGTILMSMSLAEAAAPVNVLTGQGAENVEIDYTEPGGRIDLTPYQKYERIKRAGLDDSLKEAYDRVEGAISKATLAEVLITAQPAGGVTAYAGYNLQVLQAIASIGDFKQLGEQFYNRAYEAILLLSHYTGNDIEGYGDGDKKYVIDSEDINPKSIYLHTELSPDVPVDRVQRITAGVQMSQSLPYSPKKVLEYLGETDPEGALKDWKKWQLDLADFRGRAKLIEMERSGEIQQLAQQIAQQMVMEQAQQQQEQMQQPGMGNPPNPENAPGLPGVEGQIFDPSRGMTPPAMASPQGNTFEGQRGLTRGGAPGAEGMF